MKTLRPITVLLVSALTFLVGSEIAWSQPQGPSFTQTDAQVSGTLPNSRAGLMTLGSLSGMNEMTIGAVPSVGFSGNFGDNYWDESFYTFDGFLPWNTNPGRDYFFSQIGLTMNEQGDAAGHLGFGYAHYLENLDRLIRISNFVTTDGLNEETRNAYDIRFESLGKYVDLLAGAQFVTSDSNDLVSSGLTGEEGFVGHNYLLFARSIQETAYSKADFEVGGPLAYLGDYGISAYAQLYYLWNSQADDDSIGYGIRGEWSVTEDITFNVNHTQDDIFENSTWINFAITTPDGAPRNFFRPVSVRERFSKRVHREKRIPTDHTVVDSAVAATDPKTGSVLDFMFVDPNAGFDGSGTIEAPYNNIESARLANSSLFDVILITPDITNADPSENLMLADTFDLYNDQRVLGRAIDHSIATAEVGDLFFEGLGGDNPLIVMDDTNVDPNDMFALANWNVIAGLTIDGTGPDGVTGIHTGIRGTDIEDGFDINNNMFQNVANGAIITHSGEAAAFFDDNIVEGGGGGASRGFSITQTGSGPLDLSVQRNTITSFEGEDTDGDGMLDPGEDLDGSSTLEFGVGIEVIADSGTIHAFDDAYFPPPLIAPIDPAMFGIRDNISTGNGTGYIGRADNGGTLVADVTGNDFSGNVNPNTGARIEAFAGSLVTLLAFNENTIDNNAGNGLVMHADGIDSLIEVYDMHGNSISGNGVDTMENLDGTNNNGLYMLADNGGFIDTFVGYELGLADNTIGEAIIVDGDDKLGNAGAGILVDVDNMSGVRLAILEGDGTGTVDGNGRDGLLMRADNESTILAGIFGTSFSNNGDSGIGAELAGTDPLLEGSTLILQVGDYVPGTGNTISENGGDGISLDASQESIISTGILGNIIQDNTGNGISITLNESLLVDSQIDLNSIGDLMDDGLGNGGHGIFVSTTGSGSFGIDGLLIGNIEMDGNNDNGNQIGNNTLDGVHIERNAASFVDDVAIIDNKIWDNGDDGVEIIGRNAGNELLDYNVNENWIAGNGDDGVALLVTANALMNVDMFDNIIDGNTGDGIFTSDAANTNTDTKRLTGSWTFNDIINNTGNGINITSGRHDMFVPTLDISVTDNLIDNNGIDGVLLNTFGVFDFHRNEITNNGENGMSITPTGYLEVDLLENVFAFNEQDGLEINNNGISPAGGVGLVVVSTDDEFLNNEGRGIDILNQGSGNSMIDFDEATVRDNGLEGVYVVNTPSTTQNQTDAATAALATNGNTTNNPTLVFSFTDGFVTGNGNDSTFGGTGLAIRVGTAQSGNGFADTFAGVVATVTGNEMFGNNGDDFYVDAFIATPNNPGGSTDPLARLDLTFSGNSGDSVDVNPENFAISYNNNSAIKSPWDDNRLRNATRVAGRAEDTIYYDAMLDAFMFGSSVFQLINGTQFDGPGSLPSVDNRFNPWDIVFTSGGQTGTQFNVIDYAGGEERFTIVSTAGIGVGNTFDIIFDADFAGMGESTFRVNADADTANTFTSGLDFFGSTGPIGSEANGELDSVWGILP